MYSIFLNYVSLRVSNGAFSFLYLVSNKALAQLEKQHKKAQETLDDLDSQLEALTNEMEEVRFVWTCHFQRPSLESR